MAKNKVKFGLDKVYYAKATIDPETNTATYATPVAWPGAVNLSLDPNGEVVRFRADNINYWVGESNNGYEGDFESALVPDSFKTDILNFVRDKNGVLVESSDLESQPFALIFQFKGDKHGTRHVMYNCIATRPAVASQTTEETTEPVTETATITASPIYNAALGKNIVKSSIDPEDSETTYEGWYEQVYQPVAPTP